MAARVTSGMERWIADAAPTDCEEGAGRHSRCGDSSNEVTLALGYEPFPKQQAVSRLRREVPAVWRGGRPGEIEGAADGGDPAGARAPRREHAAAAAHVSRTRAIAAALLSSATCRANSTKTFRNRSTWSRGATARPRGSDIARARATSTNTRARNFSLSASTS